MDISIYTDESTSLKRKRELDGLREENCKLKLERAELLTRIGTLESLICDDDSKPTFEDKVENEKLKQEIQLYKSFMDSFVRMAEFCPTTDEKSVKSKIYKQGVENGLQLFLGLLSQSQNSWKAAKTSFSFKNATGEPEIFYKIANGLFHTEEENGDNRLNLRVDLTHPGKTVDQVVQRLEKMFTDMKFKADLCGEQFNLVEMNSIGNDFLDADTKLLHHKKKTPDDLPNREVVFLFNKRKTSCLRSTLMKPTFKTPKIERDPSIMDLSSQLGPRKRGRPRGSNKSTNQSQIRCFGDVPCTLLIRASTSLLIAENDKILDSSDAERISNLVIDGCIVFEEDGLLDEQSKTTRSIYLSSLPQEFNESEAFQGYDTLFKDNEHSVTKEFERYLVNIVKKFNK